MINGVCVCVCVCEVAFKVGLVFVPSQLDCDDVIELEQFGHIIRDMMNGLEYNNIICF